MVTKELTRTLSECETIIERGLNTFIDVGSALLEIRDNRLYKEFYSTFEDYCRERWGWARNYANKLISASEVVNNLGTIVPTLPLTESQVRPLTQLEPEQQRDVWDRVVSSGEKVTALRVREEVDRVINKPHVAHATGENEWYTPKIYIDASREVMGSIDCDPASSERANRIVMADRYFTVQDNGLTKEWAGNIWLNPPYAQPLVTEFCNLLVEKYQACEVKQACVLVNNATETNFYQNMLKSCSAVCFIKSRVKFIDEFGSESGAPLQGQTLLYFGVNQDSFNKHFSNFGVILYARNTR